eukprot:446070-Amphidinium_carterae.1
MELLKLATNTQPRVCAVVKRLSNMLFKYQGYIGCALVLGGVDITGKLPIDANLTPNCLRHSQIRSS